MSKKEVITYQAVKALGGQVKTGELVGVTQQSVSYWVRSDSVPAEHVVKVEKALSEIGSNLDRYDLRPDVFGERPAYLKELG